MSQVGELHKKMMRRMEYTDHLLLAVEARVEHGDGDRDWLLETLQAARSFLTEALKLAVWIDTGEAEV